MVYLAGLWAGVSAMGVSIISIVMGFLPLSVLCISVLYCVLGERTWQKDSTSERRLERVYSP